jgi:gas vesicle protein
MNQEKTSFTNLAILSFVGGALLGALAVALTTPKTGPEVREALRGMGRRAKDRAGELGDQAEAVWDETRFRTEASVADLKRAMHEATDDFKRGLHEASLDLKRGVHEAATDLRVGTASPAVRSTEAPNGMPLS